MARREGPETKLVRAFIAYLRKGGHHAWRNNTGTHQVHGRWVPFGTKGSGDIFVVVVPAGRFLSVEAKVSGGKATANQVAWMEQVRAAGGVAGVASSMRELDALVAEAAHESPSLF